MFRSDLQAAGCMLEYQFLEIWERSFIDKTLFVQEKIIPDSAADVCMAYALDICDTGIKLEQPVMRTVHIPAWRRKEAGLATTFRTQFRIPSTHAIHIRSWGTHIRDIAGKARQAVQSLDFPDYGFFTTGLDELALILNFTVMV